MQRARSRNARFLEEPAVLPALRGRVRARASRCVEHALAQRRESGHEEYAAGPTRRARPRVEGLPQQEDEAPCAGGGGRREGEVGERPDGVGACAGGALGEACGGVKEVGEEGEDDGEEMEDGHIVCGSGSLE